MASKKKCLFSSYIFFYYFFFSLFFNVSLVWMCLFLCICSFLLHLFNSLCCILRVSQERELRWTIQFDSYVFEGKSIFFFSSFCSMLTLCMRARDWQTKLQIAVRATHCAIEYKLTFVQFFSFFIRNDTRWR